MAHVTGFSFFGGHVKHEIETAELVDLLRLKNEELKAEAEEARAQAKDAEQAEKRAKIYAAESLEWTRKKFYEAIAQVEGQLSTLRKVVDDLR